MLAAMSTPLAFHHDKIRPHQRHKHFMPNIVNPIDKLLEIVEF
jgi:hypothetical protein